MNYLINAVITTVFTVMSVFGVVNYASLDLLGFNNEPVLGTSLTTISGSNSLSDFPTTYNANLSTINAGKMEVSTTSIAALVGVGTITTGTWNASTLTVAYGGTGSTTLSSNQVLLGNGTGNIGVVSGFGTSGQFLTSNGDASAPTWQTSAISLSDNYTWTGLHIFNGATTVFTNASPKVGIGTTTPYAPLSVVGEVVASNFTATSTTATSTFTGLETSGDIDLGGTFLNTYTASSTAYNVSVTTTFTGSVPTTANRAIGTWKVTETGSVDRFGQFFLARNGMTSMTIENDRQEANYCAYSVAWSGDDLVITETQDTDGDCSISGTAYWYK